MAPTDLTADVGARLSLHLVPAVGVALAAVHLFGFRLGGVGHAVLGLAVLGAFALDRGLGRDLGLVALGVAIVSTTSVEADLSWDRFLTIGAVLALAVVVPFAVERHLLRWEAIRLLRVLDEDEKTRPPRVSQVAGPPLDPDVARAH